MVVRGYGRHAPARDLVARGPMKTAQTVDAESRIAELAEQIRSAAEFLTRERGYTIVALRKVARLHKNSLLRIKDLRVGYVVVRRNDRGKVEWVEAPRGAPGFEGQKRRKQWLWNPRVDTFAILENLIEEAKAQGWCRG